MTRNLVGLPLIIHPLNDTLGDVSMTFLELGWKCPRCGQIWAPHISKCDCGSRPRRAKYKLASPFVRRRVVVGENADSDPRTIRLQKSS